LAKARADVQRGLALDPRNPYLLCGLGQVEAAEGRHAEARSAFDAALREDGTIAAVWAARGAVAFDTGDADRAVADLSRALALGEDAGLLFNRAMALRALGRGAEARADLERAAALDPGDGDIRQALEEP
jgi:tetratricopeptide (TPR) repeat protein